MLSYVCAVLNLLLPGLGTIVAACSDQTNVSKTQVSMALIQFLTMWLIIGYIIAIYWSYLIIMKAREDENSV